jgi:hypothetical protein
VAIGSPSLSKEIKGPRDPAGRSITLQRASFHSEMTQPVLV